MNLEDTIHPLAGWEGAEGLACHPGDGWMRARADWWVDARSLDRAPVKSVSSDTWYWQKGFGKVDMCICPKLCPLTVGYSSLDTPPFSGCGLCMPRQRGVTLPCGKEMECVPPTGLVPCASFPPQGGGAKEEMSTQTPTSLECRPALWPSSPQSLLLAVPLLWRAIHLQPRSCLDLLSGP